MSTCPTEMAYSDWLDTFSQVQIVQFAQFNQFEQSNLTQLN